MPKWRKRAGETRQTPPPGARTASTASATKRPATSSGSRGYDVVSAMTFMPTGIPSSAAGWQDGRRRSEVGYCPGRMKAWLGVVLALPVVALAADAAGAAPATTTALHPLRTGIAYTAADDAHED